MSPSNDTVSTRAELGLQPILDYDKLRRRKSGAVSATYTSGMVARVFFDRGPDWMQQQIFFKRLTDDVLPAPAAISGKRGGNRQWTLPDVEAVAFALFENPDTPSMDAAWLLKVLDVVYAAARLQGLLPGNNDPLADLRPAMQ